MKKRFVSLLLIVVMLLSITITSTAKQFPDITLDNTDKDIFDAINYMSDNGYMVGNGGTDFNPDANVTRGMFVYLLYVYSKDEGTYTTTYTDVSVNAYYYNAVGWAQEKGITSGTSSTTFSPNNAISREQFFAILLNFCIYENHSRHLISTLTGYSDYNSLDGYARNGMNFALSHNIYTPDNNMLLPNQIINRGQLALYIHKYEIHVRGIVYSKDVFNFTNTRNYFTNGYYHIEEDVYLKIQRFLECYYTNVPERILDLLDEEIEADWGGSCYGMSMTVALDKLGILAFNENFDTNKETMRDVSTPRISSKRESIINAYQVSYDLFGNLGDTYELNEDNQAIANKALVDAVKNNTCVIFSFFWYDEESNVDPGHAVVTYRWKQDASGNYVINAYNCNTLSSCMTITVSEDYEDINISGYGNKTMTEFNLRYNFDTYRYFYDFDGTYNDGNLTFYDRGAVMTTSTDDTVEIIVPSYGNYTITNAENEKIIVKNGVQSGDMTVHSQYRSLNNSNVSNKHYTVNNSSKFTLVSDNSESEFMIYGSDYNVVVKSEKGATISVDNNKKISVTGEGGKLFASYTANGDEIKKIKIEGTYSGNAELIYTETKTNVSGMTSDLEVTYVDNNNLKDSVVVSTKDNKAFLNYSID